MSIEKKLSPVQHNVMTWLGKGWGAEPGSGSSIQINGKRVCNVDTMKSLERAGLVEQDEYRCWKATDAEKNFYGSAGDPGRPALLPTHNSARDKAAAPHS